MYYKLKYVTKPRKCSYMHLFQNGNIVMKK